MRITTPVSSCICVLDVQTSKRSTKTTQPVKSTPTCSASIDISKEWCGHGSFSRCMGRSERFQVKTSWRCVAWFRRPPWRTCRNVCVCVFPKDLFSSRYFKRYFWQMKDESNFIWKLWTTNSHSEIRPAILIPCPKQQRMSAMFTPTLLRPLDQEQMDVKITKNSTGNKSLRSLGWSIWSPSYNIWNVWECLKCWGPLFDLNGDELVWEDSITVSTWGDHWASSSLLMRSTFVITLASSVELLTVSKWFEKEGSDISWNCPMQPHPHHSKGPFWPASECLWSPERLGFQPKYSPIGIHADSGGTFPWSLCCQAFSSPQKMECHRQQKLVV